MAFTDIDTIRTHTGLSDSGRVPDALITQRLGDAHNDILRDLNPAYSDSDDAVLATAETELASAYLLRSLAMQASHNDQDHRSGDLTLRRRGRSNVLMQRADEEEARAWGHLAPFLNSPTHPHRFEPVEPSEPADSDWNADER
jgi:hypothetical protein